MILRVIQESYMIFSEEYKYLSIGIQKYKTDLF